MAASVTVGQPFEVIIRNGTVSSSTSVMDLPWAAVTDVLLEFIREYVQKHLPRERRPKGRQP